MDGHDATRTIRTVDTSVPIVGVTGNTLEHQRAEFMSCGADAVLAKPLSRREFENVVLRLLRLEISIS
jgi:CheY-like chemotaxis protein